MQVVRTIAECRAERAKMSRKKVAFVPTMGALHAGHVALLDAARKAGGAVIASIFVNPTQFGPKEDYQKYPRPIEEDLAKCEAAGVDLIFNPAAEEMYRPDVRGVPPVRDPDGLALSSRNQYLSPQERERALSINRALGIGEGEFKSGVRQTNRLMTTMQHVLLEQHLSIDYIAAVDAYTLKPVEVITAPTVLAIAARVGTTRLIDNVIVNL